jgi:soluble lytic murein transglycosylase-like protein
MDVPGSGQSDGALGRAQAADEPARLRALARPQARHTREDLARTAKEFESVFLDILMRAMRETVPENDLMGSGGATRVYRQLHDTELARTLAGTGDGLGIARLLEQQFASQFPTDDDSEEADDALASRALAASGPARAVPTPVALSRYRQAGGAAPADHVAATRRATAAERLLAGATPTHAPATGSDARPAWGPLPGGEAVPDVSRPLAAAPTAAKPEAAPSPRLDLVPVDRRLALAPMAAAEADTVRRFGPEIERAAEAAGLDPRLVLAVVMEESGGDPSARSRTGAHGLMQLMPGTARDLGVRDRLDPEANLTGGARYLADQLEHFDGRLDLALAAYNAGPGNVERAGGQVPGFRETRQYVQRVMARYGRLQGGTELDTESQ